MARSLVAALLALTVLAWPAQAQGALDTSGYAGRWSNRHFQLRLTHDGHAVAEYGLATWCATGVPRPCDSLSKDGLIEWGGLAAMTFTEARDGALFGRVDWSTTPGGTLSAGESIVLRFRADGTATLGSDDARVPITLCGSGAPVGVCGF